MKKSLRLALLACASFLGLAFAAPALAAYGPSLTMEQTSYKVGAATTADTFIFAPQNDDATAKMMIFSPAGYGANISQAPGTKIGTAVALVKAKALGGAILPLSGNVVVGNLADPAIAAAAQRCTGPTPNQAVWILDTSLQGQSVQIPDFVNKVGPLVTQQICLPSPDIPPASGGATFGAQLISADYSVKGVFTNAAAKGGYEWDGIFTPYIAGTGTVNPAGTTEWRTYVGLPTTLTLARLRSAASAAGSAATALIRFGGRFSSEGLDPRGIRLRLYAGKKANAAPNALSAGTGKPVARTRALPSSGKYTMSRPQVKVRTFFQMRFENYETSCTGPSPSGLPVPCKGEDLAPVTSNAVRVLPPSKK